MTTLWEAGRATVRRTSRPPLLRIGRGRAFDEVTVVASAVKGVQDAVRRATPVDLLEPLVLATAEKREAAAAESPILSGFLMTSTWADRLERGLSTGELRRFRVQAALSGLGLQVDGLRLELAVRLRQVLHPQRAADELARIAGVGLAAAEQGYALVHATHVGCPPPVLHDQVQAARQRAGMVRTLNLMLVENLPDPRLDS
jgi:hypothetical protein